MKAWMAALIGGLVGWAAGLAAWLLWPYWWVGLAPTVGVAAGAVAAGWWQIRRNQRRPAK